ncbi:MAG: 50S ribosomal protein L32 [Rhodothermaceae bacterium]|nr:50S ribosomal protein L32 [Rhodothermaceae bacterium]MXZ59210.1 50S ribosomal protein L32 [Rhodothermaceae bacterium]MYB90212.1 50S ribosomal protein L32 [Rhodothermaceae bacterium]MYD68612.1 50S ribosomal protein L32 [Rhodothermaceae bacterium]MYG45744.1 50S ribosomal protein L32 [Rhodothermaceae bacterium]
MANPRRKHSKSRTRKRRSVYYGSLSAPTKVECEDCDSVKLRHRICPSCGMYRGRQIVERPADV